MNSHAQDCIELTDYAEVARRRTELEGGIGEIWDIATPDGSTTIRIAEDDATVHLYVFTGGRAQINDGHMTFRGALAAPGYVAAAIDQIVGEYL